MFSPQCSRFTLALTLLTILPLAGCFGSQTLEGALKPDPNVGQWQGGQPQVTLPETFPAELRYQNAALVGVNPGNGDAVAMGNSSNSPNNSGTTPTSVQTRWRSPDSPQAIKDFYLTLFQKPEWQLQQQDSGSGLDTLVARRGDLRVGVAIPTASSTTQPGGGTEFALQYTPTATTPTGTLPSPTGAPTGPTPTATTPAESSLPGNPSPGPVGVAGTSPVTTSPQSFADLSTAPPQLQPYLQDLSRLGVLSETSPKSNQGNFNPNQPIRRRTFVRWLVVANNRFYQDRPARQIRLAGTGSPLFRDVPTTDPDFAYIQGLAAAGFIPSSLTGNTSLVQFQPDAPLTREVLLQWKVPIDLRQNLPAATLEGVKQSWGFKDANRIAPEALQAVNADYQNGDLANIRRLFGTTLLLQPKHPVTRAEAAAALWYIGVQGDGLSAQNVWQPPSPANTAGSPTASPNPSSVSGVAN